MQKILISLPDKPVSRMNAVFPKRRRSKIIAALLENEVKKLEEEFYACACEVEADEALNREMEDWDVTTDDCD